VNIIFETVTKDQALIYAYNKTGKEAFSGWQEGIQLK